MVKGDRFKKPPCASVSLKPSLTKTFGNGFADFRHFIRDQSDYVVERDDANDRIMAVDDWNAADVEGMHQRSQVTQIFVHGDADRVRRHNIFHARLFRIPQRAGDL